MSDEITIITNNVPRPVLSGYELTESERKDFDYIADWNETQVDFFRYKGEVYDLSDFSYMHNPQFPDWHGIQPDSFFSGILVRSTNDSDDEIIVGRYYC